MSFVILNKKKEECHPFKWKVKSELKLSFQVLIKPMFMFCIKKGNIFFAAGLSVTDDQSWLLCMFSGFHKYLTIGTKFSLFTLAVSPPPCLHSIWGKKENQTQLTGLLHLPIYNTIFFPPLLSHANTKLHPLSGAWCRAKLLVIGHQHPPLWGRRW